LPHLARFIAMRKAAAVAFVCLALGSCDTLREYAGAAQSKFIVFFAGKSTELPDDGKAIVKTAAAKIEQTHPASVVVAAGTKSGESMELSEPRFAAVRQALISYGVRQDLIARAPIPGPKLATTSVAENTADQRVEIRLLDGKP
jgi:outer membrane protein OmpA-like peptidoglycan-associated protein